MKKIASVLGALGFVVAFAGTALADDVRTGHITNLQIAPVTADDPTTGWKIYIWLDSVDGTNVRMCGASGVRATARMDPATDKDAVQSILTAAFLAGKTVTLSTLASGTATCYLESITVASN